MRSPVRAITDDQLDEIDGLRQPRDAYALLMARKALQHLLGVYDGKAKPCAKAIANVRAMLRAGI